MTQIQMNPLSNSGEGDGSGGIPSNKLVESITPDFRATITQRLVSLLTERIIAGAYAPGANLRETELVTQYKVSRHVIREVLRTLSADGLVEYASFKGARVPSFTKADAHDIYQARRLAECSSGAMTVLPDLGLIERIHQQFVDAVSTRSWARAFELDADFHCAIVAASGSKRISDWHHGLLQALRLAHLVTPTFNKQAWAISVEQHALIADAIRAGDVPQARDAMRSHLEESERILVDDMGSRP